MATLLTNITGNILNQNIIKESFTKLKNKDELNDEEITEIFYLNEEIPEENQNFNNINVNNFKIDMDKDMDEVYDNITQIIKVILDKKEFIDVIVDTSFLAYLILEVLIKKFDIIDVFILENNKLKKAHPCGCGEEYMGY